MTSTEARSLFGHLFGGEDRLLAMTAHPSTGMIRYTVRGVSDRAIRERMRDQLQEQMPVAFVVEVVDYDHG